MRSFLIVLFVLSFVTFSSFITESKADVVSFQVQDDAARARKGPTLQLKEHVRIVESDEILKIQKEVEAEWKQQLDVEYLLDLARRGQVVAVDGELNGAPHTWYGLRESLNNITPKIADISKIYDQIEDGKNSDLIVMSAGLGTSIHSAVMEQWGDVDINYVLLEPHYKGDPDSLRNSLPLKTAERAAKHIQSVIARLSEKFDLLVFTEAKAGNPQPEPFHPHTPPKGEKWTYQEIMKGEKTIQMLDAQSGQMTSHVLTLAEALRDDTYVKFDFYTLGVADRAGELIEVTACYRFGALTDDGKVYLRQSERQLHFPPARSTTFFPDKASFVGSTMANEFEYPMPTTPRANQLMVGKIHEVLTTGPDNPYPRYAKANKVIAARMNFWPDLQSYQYLSKDPNATLEYMRDATQKVGNEPTVKRLSNLLSETKAFDEIAGREAHIIAKSQDVIDTLINGYAGRVSLVNAALAEQVVKTALGRNQATAEFAHVIHDTKEVVQKAESETSKKILDQYPSLYHYMLWVKDRFQYLDRGVISNRATLIAYPAPHRMKEWYREKRKVIAKKYPHLLSHNPADLHLTIMFIGNTTAQTKEAARNKDEELFKGRRMYIKLDKIGILGSEGTYVGATWLPDPADKEDVELFQHTTIAYGAQPTRFLGNYHPHNTLFWIPKNHTVEEEAEFEAFKASPDSQMLDELMALFPDGKLLLSGTPMFAETNRAEAAMAEPGKEPEKMYKVEIPAQPVQEDIEAGLVDSPVETEAVKYDAPKDVVIAWDAPDSIVQWLGANYEHMSKMFPLLTITRPQNAHIPLAYSKNLDPTAALTISRQQLEPMEHSKIREEFPTLVKGGAKEMKSVDLVGSRLLFPEGFERRESQSLGSSRDAIAFSFSIGSEFKSEVLKIRQAIADFLKIPVPTLQEEKLYLTVARVKLEKDGKSLSVHQVSQAKQQLDMLARLFKLPELLGEERARLVNARSAGANLSPLKISKELAVSLKTLSRSNMKWNTNFSDVLIYGAHGLLKTIKVYNERPDLERLERVLDSMSQFEQILIVRGLETQPYTIHSKPNFYGALPPSIRVQADKKYVRLPLATSKSRSLRDLKDKNQPTSVSVCAQPLQSEVTNIGEPKNDSESKK